MRRVEKKKARINGKEINLLANSVRMRGRKRIIGKSKMGEGDRTTKRGQGNPKERNKKIRGRKKGAVLASLSIKVIPEDQLKTETQRRRRENYRA